MVKTCKNALVKVQYIHPGGAMRKLENIIMDEFANCCTIQKNNDCAKLYEEMIECESKIMDLIGKENLSLWNKYKEVSDKIIYKSEEQLVSFSLDFTGKIC